MSENLISLPDEDRRAELLSEYLIAGRSPQADKITWVDSLTDPDDRAWIKIVAQIVSTTIQTVASLIEAPDDPEKGWFTT